jgi:hypothetical protein
MIDGRLDLPAEAGQIWVRRDASSPWEVDFVIAEERDGKWVWRPTRPLPRLGVAPVARCSPVAIP